MNRLVVIVFLSVMPLLSCVADPKPMEHECNLFEKKTESGDLDAQIMLANCYATGIGRDRDLDVAEFLLRESVKSDLVAAANNLGALLLFKRPNSEQHTEGIQFLQKAKNNGAVNASTNLGIAYLVGRGVAADAQAGLQSLHFSADRGEVLASLLLFSAYELGYFEAKKNADLANEYWRLFYRHFEKFPREYFHWYVEKLGSDGIVSGIIFTDDQLEVLIGALKEREGQVRDLRDTH